MDSVSYDTILYAQRTIAYCTVYGIRMMHVYACMGVDCILRFGSQKSSLVVYGVYHVCFRILSLDDLKCAKPLLPDVCFFSYLYKVSVLSLGGRFYGPKMGVARG